MRPFTKKIVLTVTLLAVGMFGTVIRVGGGGVYGHSQPAAPAESQRQPDIVLVTIDALRADHISAYGHGRLTTPAIDAFMRRHVRFTNAIAQAPYTKASVASLMTGLYPTTHGAVTTSVPFPETMTGRLSTRPIVTDVLSSRASTLAAGLRAAGYHTAGFTANPFLLPDFGFANGFDVFQFFAGSDFASADRVVGAAIDATRASDAARPMFLWVHIMEPHSPYTPPPLTAGMFKPAGPPEPIHDLAAVPSWLVPGTPNDLRLYTAAYDDEIAYADAAFDWLVREFASVRSGRGQVVVVTADHGEQFLDHDGWEHSTNLYDELIRVPLGIQIERHSGVVDSQVQLIDLFPTLLELGGADVPPNAGHSLRRLHGADVDDRPAVSEIVGSQYALRNHGFKLIESSDGRAQLFDLSADPAERHDIAESSRPRLAEMRAQLHAILSQAVTAGRDVDRETTPVDPALVERLRSLGYAR